MVFNNNQLETILFAYIIYSIKKKKQNFNVNIRDFII